MSSAHYGLFPTSADCDPADCATPAANTAAVLTYPADPAAVNVLAGVACSYSGGVPAGGNLKIEDGPGNVVFSVDITSAGPCEFVFAPAKRNAAAGTALVVTLAAGGAGVLGKVSALARWKE